jgi:hypothetical protein
MKATAGLMAREVRIAYKSSGIKMAMVLKRNSKESSGRGETFKINPRKKLKSGGCACR